MQTKRLVLFLFFSCCLVLSWICADDIEGQIQPRLHRLFFPGISKIIPKIENVQQRLGNTGKPNITKHGSLYCPCECTCNNTRHRPVRWKADESREKAGWRSCRKTLLYSRLMSCPVWIIDFRNKDRSLHGRLQPGMWSGLWPDPQ